VGKLSKSDLKVDYVHHGDGNYRCDSCKLWNPNKLCLLFSIADRVQPWGGCNFHTEGTPSTNNYPLAVISPKAAGYVETPFKNGYGCRRCEYFDRGDWKCEKVSENGLPDNGVIHPMGCCNKWEVDKVFGAI